MPTLPNGWEIVDDDDDLNPTQFNPVALPAGWEVVDTPPSAIDQAPAAPTPTQTASAIPEPEPEEPGMWEGIKRGSLRAGQSLAALGQGIINLDDRLTRNIFGEDSVFADNPARNFIRDTTNQGEAVRILQEQIDEVPVHSTMQEAIERANKADSFLGAVKEFGGAVADSDDKLGFFMNQLGEQVPVMASMFLGTKGAGSVIKGGGLAAQSGRIAAGSGMGSVASTYGSNVAEGLGRGLSFDDAENRGLKRSAVQGIVDGTAGAFVPLKIGPSQFINVPTQALIQAAGGAGGEALAAKSVGDDISYGELAAEGLLEMLGLPGDVAAAVADSRASRLGENETRPESQSPQEVPVNPPPRNPLEEGAQQFDEMVAATSEGRDVGGLSAAIDDSRLTTDEIRPESQSPAEVPLPTIQPDQPTIEGAGSAIEPSQSDQPIGPLTEPEVTPEAVAPETESPVAPVQFQTPNDYRRKESDARIDKIAAERGLDPDTVAALKDEFAPAPEMDSTFEGYFRRGERQQTVERAIAHVQETGQKAFYIEADVQNLGGLNAAQGTSQADVILNEMGKIALSKIQESGGQVVPIRRGGDELSYVVIGAEKDAVDSAIESMEQATQAFAEEKGLSDLPHTKAGRSSGFGILSGVSEISVGDSPEIIYSTADGIVEKRKKATNVERTQTGEAGDDPSGGQAGGIGEGPGRSSQRERKEAGGEPEGVGSAPAAEPKPSQDNVEQFPDSLGIPRDQMPQIPSDRVQSFLKDLRSTDVTVQEKHVPASTIKPTQIELNREKVEKFKGESDENLAKPVILSSDGYLLDGHHRWQALKEKSPNAEVPAKIVDLPINDLLERGRSFSGAEFQSAGPTERSAEKPKAGTESTPDAQPEAAPEAAPEPSTTPTETSPAQSGAAPLEDFGEVIPDARKHVYTFNRAQTDAIAEMDLAEIAKLPKSKLFPKPDYEKLIESGTTVENAATLNVIYAMVPASKPRRSYGLKSWAENVQTIVALADRYARNDTDSVEKLLSDPKHQSLQKKIVDRRNMLLEMGFPDAPPGAEDYTIEEAIFTLYNGEKGRFKKYVPTKHNTKGGLRKEIDLAFDTREEAIEALKNRLAAQSLRSKGVKFDIFTDRSQPGKVFLGKKVAAGKWIELQSFDNSRDAREYLRNNQSELEQQLAEAKKIPAHRRETNNVRVGDDYRGGENVTPEMFDSTFGFRGVQFGNYVEGPRRQDDLNNTYDAFMDMAKVLNVPPKALSLNGELGLAFGARGRGGKRAAKAHYEAGHVVINLTKNAGPGSLAHEWWHALDNYFERSRGRRKEFLSNSPHPRPQRGVDGGSEDIRTAVVDAFKAVTRIIRSSDFKTRSAENDSVRSKDHYSTMIEMTARAFESYVIDRAAAKGIENDFLANIATLEGWEAMRGPGSYPYLTADEVASIGAEYDKLFDVIETKTTDRGVAFYSQQATPGGGSTAQAIQSEITKSFGTKALRRMKVTMADSTDQIAEMAGLPKSQVPGDVQGATLPDGRVILFPANIEPGKGAAVFAHEGVHAVVSKRMRDNGTWGSTVRRLQAMRDRGDKQVKAAYDRIPDDTPIGLRDEEALAYLVENNPEVSVVQRFLAAVRKALNALGVPMKWINDNADDIRIAAIDSLRRHLSDNQSSKSPEKIGEAVPRFSVNKPDESGEITSAQREAMVKAGLADDPNRNLGDRLKETVEETWETFKTSAADELKQGVADRFNRISSLEQLAGGFAPEQSGYVAARLSTGASTTVRAALIHGAPTWKDGIIQKKDGSKGLLEALEPVKGDLDRWVGWMVGNRAERLKIEGRENLLSVADIAALQSLADTPERKARFVEAKAEYSQLQSSILDLAQDAGLIDPDQRSTWEHGDYIPFYREGQSGGKGKGAMGLSHQSSGIKRLRGGSSKLKDPVGNIIQNMARLIEGSMKNRALLQTLDNLDSLDGIMENVSPKYRQAVVPMSQIKKILRERGVSDEQLKAMPPEAMRGMQKMWSMEAPTADDVIRVMRDGKAEYYKVNDPMLLRSLTAVNMQALESTRWLRPFKRILTAGITSDPSFMVRNFLRDALHSWTITESGFKPGIDSLRGLGKSLREKGGMIDMMFAGGSFQGGYINATDPEEMTSVVRRTLREKGFKAKDINKHVETLIYPGSKAWSHWRRVGDAFENANREAIYEAAIKSGKTKAQAAFEAKDIMDFSMRGDYLLVRFFTDVVPFLNPRIQGLYKLGRAFTPEMRGKILMRSGLITAGSMALMAANWDNDDYDELEEWDKDTYWHIAPGTKHHTRIPKPFEIGLLFGTIPERMIRNLGDKDSSKVTAEAVARGIHDTLAIDWMPQAFKPAMEVRANKNSFTGRPIENMGDEGKLPSARYNENTSDTMRILSEKTSELTDLSPKQLEHLWRGYTGTMGAYVLQAVDWMVAEASDKPTRPTKTIAQYPVVGSFFKGDAPPRSTRFQTELYDMLKESEQIYRTVTSYAKEGRIEKAQELANENALPLVARDALREGSKELSLIRQGLDEVYRNETLTANEKRQLVDQLLRRRNAVTKAVMMHVKKVERRVEAALAKEND